MPPKKKLKPSNPQPSSSNTKPDVVNCELYFDLLPTEILVKIAQFMTPVDIGYFLKVCSPRCAEAACHLKKLSYDACRRVELEHMHTLINSVCLANIVEINFNNVCHISGSNLVSVIVRCKHLITLSVINCGIVLKNVTTILQRCKKLENFSWDVQYQTKVPMNAAREFCAPKLKNVFLLLNNLFYQEEELETAILLSLHFVFSLCPLDVNLYLNYSNVPIFHPTRFCHAYQINSTFLTKPVTFFSDLFLTSNYLKSFKDMILGSMLQPNDASLRQFISASWAFRVSSVILLRMMERNRVIPEFFTEGLSYLQFTYDKDATLCLENFPVNDIESLSIVLDYLHPPPDPKAITEGSLKYLKLPKLKNLSAQEGIHFEIIRETDEIAYQAAFKALPLLSLFIRNAPNITTLNFSGIHVGSELPIKDISCLKCLETISIPACGMLHKVEFEFLEVITSCTEVKQFSLTKCILCSEGPGEKQLVYLKHWKKMMDLNITNVPALRICTFLRAVADSCADLRVLHLTDLGHKSVCHYIPNIIYVLRTSKRLQLLRLHQAAFHLDNTLFWNAIKSASNLEGLCITSYSDSHPPVQKMLSAFKELKFLFLLHLKVRNLPQDFESRVKQILREHQVKNHQLAIRESDVCHLYHFGYPYLHDVVDFVS